jgi:hypothetical protein
MKWVSVSYERLQEFVQENNLIRKNEGMHTFYYNADGVMMARDMHGFVKNEFDIFTLENEETLSVVANIINK